MRMPGRFLAQGAATLLMTMPVVAHPLDRGMAIVDPQVIEELDRDFGVAQMLGGIAPGSGSITNDKLFARPGMAEVRKYILRRIEDYNKEFNQGEDDPRVLDVRFVQGAIARFQLAGVVNRMDRGFVAELKEACGETRLIYRLFYKGTATVGGVSAPVESRLPMTLNLTLRANTGDGCAALAKRWLDAPPETAAPRSRPSITRPGERWRASRRRRSTGSSSITRSCAARPASPTGRFAISADAPNTCSPCSAGAQGTRPSYATTWRTRSIPSGSATAPPNAWR